MKLLADENVDPFLVRWLREQGHDVSSVQEIARGAADPEVLNRAAHEDRIMLTADKGFGDLVYRQGYATAGVILLRLHTSSRQDYLDRFMHHFPAIAHAQPGRFVTVTNQEVRIRPLLRSI